MVDKEFNLLDEGWIKVRKKDCTVDTLSLVDAILKSHEYVDLAGELPTQDVAMLRLMLAVVHTAISRYDLDGNEKMLQKPQEALNRWSKLWNAGKFPEKPIRTYLETWYERFWLFHPERPFYQTPAAKIGTLYTAAKLNGTLSESSNKIRLFADCFGKEKEELSYAEAARWLLYVNSYDDTSSKPKGKDLPSPGVGWLGKLGLIVACGNTLFETLMYNLILLDPKRNFGIWEPEQPTWELTEPHNKERDKINTPKSLAELYTLQSRRLFLLHENEKVIGYNLLGGDFFEKEDAFVEPMTVWNAIKGSTQVQPKRHDSSMQMWREFSATFATEKAPRIPGIVSWIGYLRKAKLVEQQHLIRFRIASVQYGDKDFFVNDLFSDSLTFHTDLLTELGKNWQTYITEEVAKCDELAKAMRQLAKSLELAKGVSPDNAVKCSAVQSAGEQLYYEIDVPFRQWLASIDPGRVEDSEEKDNVIQAWRNTAKGIALKLGEELVNASGPAAFVGRTVEENKKEDKKSSKKEKKKETTNEDSKCVYYCAPMAFQEFENEVKYGIYKGGVR